MNFFMVVRWTAATRRQSRERIYHGGKKPQCITRTAKGNVFSRHSPVCGHNLFPMRTLPKLFLFAVGLACWCFTGCSPKPTKGQVFIVTGGAENVKLGLVDVLVFDEQGVAMFLEKKKSAVESEVSSRTENLRNAEKKLQEVQHALDEFQKTNDAFQPAFLEQKSQLPALKREVLELNNGPTEARLATMKKMEALQSQMLRPRASQSLTDAADQLEKALKLKKELDAIDRQEKEIAPMLAAKKARLAEVEKQITAVNGPSEKQVAALSSRVASCKAEYENVSKAAEQFPTLEFYLSDPLPAPHTRTLTDADGRFELKLPRKGRFAVFARATRKVGTASENYAWFFWLPTATDDTPLLLSNNNLVFADHLGHVLPIRPKETQ